MTSRRSTVLGPAYHKTLLESAFPFRELSLIARADQRATDPVYSVHRWWARRPPSVMRGLLLAAAMPADVSADALWREFQSPGHSLAAVKVLDPFLGGGTTAVEAARLGAVPCGYDIDPLSILITRHELEPPDAHEFETAAHDLLEFLSNETGDLYPAPAKAWQPLHYFYLHEVECPGCGTSSALYKNLVIARDVEKRGAVVRPDAVTAFCPSCFRLKGLADPEQQSFFCCGERRFLNRGTYRGFRFHCPNCEGKWLHSDLRTGLAPRRLVAVEDTSKTEYRRIRSPRKRELTAETEAASRLTRERDRIDLAPGPFETSRRDQRPISYGIDRPAQLFSPRQLLTFGYAFQWVRDAAVTEPTRRALLLSLSNALTTNNKLCGYATDYGRLAPLFSIRSYSLPLLPVELNPHHQSGGRGTLERALARTLASTSQATRRYVWSPKRRRATAALFSFQPTRGSNNILCASAEAPPDSSRTAVDLCVFDPPYFDFIAYSELSEFYRAWLRQGDLGGAPLLPDPDRPAATFGMRFARALRAALGRLDPGRPLAFTYHSGNEDAWNAVGLALDNSGLRVTALWPLRNDGHMGHHAADGNCEWDVVVVCRRSGECEARAMNLSVKAWRKAVSPLRIRKADAQAIDLAIEMARNRFGAVRVIRSGERA